MSSVLAVWRPVTASLALVLGLIVAGPLEAVQAHDELTGTEPSDGVELDSPPGEVRLEFSGEIAAVGTVVTVTGPLGEITDGDPEVEGPTVIQPLSDDTPSGDYTVVWRVTSQDGHPISGEFGYQIATAAAEAQSGEDTTATSTAPDASQGRDDEEATTGGTDRAANTAAAPAQGDESDSSGTAFWVWGVLALALVTLGGLGAAAIRRR